MTLASSLVKFVKYKTQHFTISCKLSLNMVQATVIHTVKTFFAITIYLCHASPSCTFIYRFIGAKICSRRIGKFVRCKVLGSVAQLKERSLVTPEIHGSHPAIAFFYVKYWIYKKKKSPPIAHIETQIKYLKCIIIYLLNFQVWPSRLLQ